MIRGTTATLKLVTDKDWTGWKVWVTIEDKYAELTIKEDRVEIAANIIYVHLSQDETLQFTGPNAKVQVKGEKDGIVDATIFCRINVYDVLCEEVM